MFKKIGLTGFFILVVLSQIVSQQTFTYKTVDNKIAIVSIFDSSIMISFEGATKSFSIDPNNSVVWVSPDGSSAQIMGNLLTLTWNYQYYMLNIFAGTGSGASSGISDQGNSGNSKNSAYRKQLERDLQNAEKDLEFAESQYDWDVKHNTGVISGSLLVQQAKKRVADCQRRLDQLRD